MRSSVKGNQKFIDQMIQPHVVCEIDTLECGDMDMEEKEHALFHQSGADQENVKSTLRQFVRDWSEEGSIERQNCYGPILETLESLFTLNDRNMRNVLVPGAGIGRLALEIAQMGFNCQGNEFSYYMLIASEFLLNRTSQNSKLCLFPYCLSTSNQRNVHEQCRAINIPDKVPSIPSGVDFSMVAGDFLQVYGDQEGQWDVVVTCFFLDTAKNIVEYLDTIYRCLVVGGTWIHLGPLLYHYENMEDEMSIEITMEELIELVKTYSFSIKSQSVIRTSYAKNLSSMMNFEYDCLFLTVEKTE